MADKSYESYQMLAKLLNSKRKENIDRAYDALSSVLYGNYNDRVEESKSEYANKRDALARNKAKSDKYLSYFMTEKGYNGSGIEADAKLKSELSYNSDLSALDLAETSDLAKKRSEYNEAQLKNEAERAEKKGAADKDESDTLYRIYDDEKDYELKSAQLEQQRKAGEDELAFKREQQQKLDEYRANELALDRAKLDSDNAYKQRQLEAQNTVKEKEYEIKLLKAEAEAAKTQAASQAKSSDAKDLQDKLDAYRQLMYQNLKAEFERTNDLDEKQRIYDSVTGVNTETAAEIYGKTLYNEMIRSFSKGLTDAKVKKSDEDTVNRLYQRFVDANNEYHYQTYMKLKRELEYSNFPGFTSDQLERAYKMYVNNSKN